ncbi:t-SNARE [Cutaneotrichosporon oleaginosum]|uniref:t-SNARE n=1 Tax=Cutaneotrichosporon oleaginosum TaxID=879819 RepID=A0A0J0XBF9_9TREE|nr:t-SNARE [Cutaneotrichosporon oleaginosum]KLT38400.1 t-SNARE [Cutaneotrichosporon oleaginosum]TXT13857.1 hypothetical protein COLE_00050 [Cutaneotrichosporon oleaginosum]
MNPYAPHAHASSSKTPDGPVTRSRTLFYLSVRDSSSFGSGRAPRLAAAQYGDTVDVEDDERGGLLAHARVDMQGLPPKWVDKSDEVEEILERITAKVAALDKLHAKHVLPAFTDRSAEEREIERQTSDITRDFRRASKLVASIAPGKDATRAEKVTAKNVQRGLARKIQEASGHFRVKQRVYMQKLQGHSIKNKDLLAASGAITLRGTDSYDALAEDEEASQAQLQSQTQSGVALDIEQRTHEITQIASSISELADLFRDLGNLVVEQGTVLDSVEYNVQQTAKQMDDAVQELQVARRYQSNTGKRKCILLLILLIVAMIIILIYKPRRGSSPPTPTPASGVVGAPPAPPPTTSLNGWERPNMYPTAPF